MEADNATNPVLSLIVRAVLVFSRDRHLEGSCVGFLPGLDLLAWFETLHNPFYMAKFMAMVTSWFLEPRG